MKEKKMVSFSEQIKKRFLLNGITWVLAGIFLMFDNKICAIISCVFLLISTYLLVSPFFGKNEKGDEMSNANIDSAMSTAFMIGHIVLVLISLGINMIAVKVLNFDIDVTAYVGPAIYIFLGIQDFIVGFKFKKLEE